MKLTKRQKEVIKNLRRKLPEIDDVIYVGKKNHTKLKLVVTGLHKPVQLIISCSTTETLDRWCVVTEARGRIREARESQVT